MMLVDIAAIETLRIEADHAWSKISRNPDRLHELPDPDFDAICAHMEALRPFTAAVLLVACCSRQTAEAEVAIVERLPQDALVSLIESAHRNVRSKKACSRRELAALAFDTQIGWRRCFVEFERREAAKASALN